MVSVGSQAYVAVGTQCEKRDFFKAEEIGCGGFKASDLYGLVRVSTEDDGGLEQG
jgi:hypothetical protein